MSTVVTVRDVRKHLPLPDGKAVSDFQIHCFLMMHRGMEDAKAEKEDRRDTDTDVMDSQDAP